LTIIADYELSVGQQQFNMSTVYTKHHRHFFSSWLSPLLLYLL